MATTMEKPQPPVEASAAKAPPSKLGQQVADMMFGFGTLNEAFERIKVADIPPPRGGQIVEISSEATVEEAMDIMVRHGLSSAPILNAEAPSDASWLDRYVGVVDFSGIVLWAIDMAYELTPPVGFSQKSIIEAIKKHQVARSQKVKALALTFGWAPFLPVELEDNLLTVMLILGKYGYHRVPVVQYATGPIKNIITQSAIVHQLAQCESMPWYQEIASKKVIDCRLIGGTRRPVVTVDERRNLMEAFRVMVFEDISAVPVVDANGKLIGNISAKDVRSLLYPPEGVALEGNPSVGDFMRALAPMGEKTREGHRLDVTNPVMMPPITCRYDDTLAHVIRTIDRLRVHRIYAVDDEGRLLSVVTVRDLIACFVSEPPNFFGPGGSAIPSRSDMFPAGSLDDE